MNTESDGHALFADQLGFGFDDAASITPAPVPTRTRKARIVPPAPASEPLTPEAMALALERHADYRVLRRLPVQQQFAHQAGGPVTRLLILDTETTGLDASRDRIMELALLRVDVDNATGLPTGTVDVYDGLEDPGMPIPPEIQELTGISDDMVRGHKLDESRVAAMLAGADLVIAHNAGFDRPFVEARLAQFAQLPWACSFADLDWKKEGRGSAKLTQLALELGWFYDAHRAEMDCHALLAVLASPLPVCGQTGLAQLLSVAARPSYRLQATAAPFEAKDLLKARGYRWDGEHRVWHTRLGDEAQLQAECEWLKASVYGNRAARVQVERLDAGNRYSLRPGKVEPRAL
ncbi:MAG: 3'-5' exonuclease [Polaromonas sp.]|uniref:3'-5' exonuclease n=1 Tax=Polaromonas sp. TaxID=1869339 RepID=UPI00272FBB78|nr:3'-5' exonuclease [Polaromonas sp.]MDP2449871.1 3'-5' exonuclease [Polaromonas sp.]MDP3248377.1 3'-5' exonuclease [Polaromonas sp.]